MTPRFRGAALVALRFLVIGAALLFLVRGVDWTDVRGTLRSTNLLLLASVVAVNGGMTALKASRLRLLLGQAPSFKSCFLAKLTASAINNVVPFRGGDMARVWMLERHARITKSAAAAVGVVEVLFDLISLAVLAFVGALVLREQRWAVVTTSIVLIAAVALVWVLKRMNGNRPLKSADEPPANGLLGRIRRLAQRVGPGIRALREPETAASAMALSLIVWVFEMSMVMLCARAIHLTVGPALAMVTLLGINLAMALPSMPASAGAFESGATLVLVLSGIPKGSAIAFALLYHVIQVVPVTLAGLAVVSKAGLTLDRLPAPEAAE